MKTIKSLMFFLCAALFLTTATGNAAEENTVMGRDVAASARGTSSGTARGEAVRNYGLDLGMATGRSDRFIAIKESYLKPMAAYLNDIFDVSHFYLEGGRLQPPVIVESKSLFQGSADGMKQAESDVRYSVLAPAKLVTEPIQWRTYLIPDTDLVSGVTKDDFLEPRNSEEQQIFKQAYAAGYREGVAQATAEVSARMALLTTIKNGFRLYEDLRGRNVITEARVSKGDFPIQGNSTQLTIGTKEFTVSQAAQFNLNGRSHKAPVIVSE